MGEEMIGGTGQEYYCSLVPGINSMALMQAEINFISEPQLRPFLLFLYIVQNI